MEENQESNQKQLENSELNSKPLRNKFKEQNLITIIPQQLNETTVEVEHNAKNQQIYEKYIENKLKQKVQEKQQEKKRYYNVSDIKEISDEDKAFLVLDQDTGLYYDIRHQEQELSQSFLQLNVTVQDVDQKENDQLWKEFWDKLNKYQEDLIDFAEIGDIKGIQKLFNITKQKSIPLDIDFKGFDDFTALHTACSEGNMEIVKLLIQNNANVDAPTKFRRTSLHLASLRGFIEIVEILLEAGAKTDCQDKEKCTPLNYACENGFSDVVDILLKYKADAKIKTIQGITAQEQAQSKPKIQQIFYKYGYSQIIPYNQDRKRYIDRILFQGSKGKVQMNNQQEQAKPEPPKKYGLEDFNIYKVLGKGAFGKVYLAKRKDDDSKFYALKMLDKRKIKESNLVKYAKVEKNVMALMKHPFIVELNYTFQTKNALFLVMQFCPGGDLSDKLDEKDKFDEKTAKIYLAEIILALEACHRNNILFRDLKPANILLDQDGHAQLADFGLANHQHDKEGFKNNLRKSFLGTPAYLAPEMIRKQGHNRMIDWYLLGVLLYEFLTGITPYYANTKQELFKNIVSGALRMPSSGISPQAKDLIIKLLNRNPTRRLGYENGADDIKNHQFFNDIDWNKILNKEYPVERPLKREYPGQPLNIDVLDSLGSDPILEIEEWSFVRHN